MDTLPPAGGHVQMEHATGRTSEETQECGKEPPEGITQASPVHGSAGHRTTSLCGQNQDKLMGKPKPRLFPPEP